MKILTKSIIGASLASIALVAGLKKSRTGQSKTQRKTVSSVKTKAKTSAPRAKAKRIQAHGKSNGAVNHRRGTSLKVAKHS